MAQDCFCLYLKIILCKHSKHNYSQCILHQPMVITTPSGILVYFNKTNLLVSIKMASDLTRNLTSDLTSDCSVGPFLTSTLRPSQFFCFYFVYLCIILFD